MHTDQSDTGSRPWDAALREARGAAFVIDTAAARLVGANAAGRALWLIGPERPELAVALDRAMPALRQIGALIPSSGSGPAGPTQLTFWRAGGVVQGRFSVRRLDDLCVLVEQEGDGRSATPAAPGRPVIVVADEPPPAAPLSAEPLRRRVGDLETLEEIARRIRSGASHSRRRPEPAAAEQPPPAVPVPLRTQPTRPPPPAAPAAAQPAGTVDAERLLERMAADAAAILAADGTGRLGMAAEVRDQLVAIESAARAGLALIRAKPPRALVFTEVDLAALVDASVARRGPALADGGVRLSASAGRRMPLAVADRAALGEICDGLLDLVPDLAPVDGAASLALRHVINGPAVLALSLCPSADAEPILARRLGPLSRLARATGCALVRDLSDTGMLTLRLEIPKDRLIPV